MSRRRTLGVVGDRRATTALELAFVLPILSLVLLGGLETGLIWWTNGTLQSIAAMTARCAAVGTNACSNPSAYANTQAATLLPTLTITTTGNAPNFIVSVATTTATSDSHVCNMSFGTFKVVTITASLWSGSIFHPLAGKSETLTACYPT